MIEIAKISRHSRSRESRDQDRDFDTALEVDGDLDEKKTPTLENDRSHDKKSGEILGLLLFVFNHRVLHLLLLLLLLLLLPPSLLMLRYC